MARQWGNLDYGVLELEPIQIDEVIVNFFTSDDVVILVKAD
ncbi:MAG: hypothetical protein ACRC3H_03290 [Lachnospiraceae bacterium]